MTDRDFNWLARRIRPAEDIANRRALREVLSDGAGVKAKALPRELLTSGLFFSVSGSITAGSSIAQQWVMPTYARIRSVQVRFKTAPGAAQQISLMADGSPIVVVAVGSGVTSAGQSAAEDVAPGTLMEIKASASTGSTLSVTVLYEPTTE